MTDDPRSTPLERLKAFAREQTENQRATAVTATREQREREALEAIACAMDDFAQHFTVDHTAPPRLEWTGYPSTGRDDEPRHRIQATAYLGEGVFLAYHRPRPGDDFSSHAPFTLVAIDHPDQPGQPAPARVDNLTELAEAVSRIETARHDAAVAKIRSEIQ